MYIYCFYTFSIVREYIHTNAFLIYDIYCSDIREYTHTNSCIHIHIHQSIYKFVRVYMDTYGSDVHMFFFISKVMYAHHSSHTPNVPKNLLRVYKHPFRINMHTFFNIHLQVYMHVYTYVHKYIYI